MKTLLATVLLSFLVSSNSEETNLSQTLVENQALDIIHACQNKYEEENDGFFKGLIRSDRKIFSEVLISGAGCKKDLTTSLTSGELEELIKSIKDIKAKPFEAQSLAYFNRMGVQAGFEALLKHHRNFDTGVNLDYPQDLEKLKAKLKRRYPTLAEYPDHFEIYFEEALEKSRNSNIKLKSKLQTQKALKSFGAQINQHCKNIRKTVLEIVGPKPHVNGGVTRRAVRRNQKTPAQKYQEKLTPFKKLLSEQITASQLDLQNEDPALASLLYSKAMRRLIPLDKEFIDKCINPKKDLPIEVDRITRMNTNQAILGVQNFIHKDLNLSEKGIAAVKSSEPDEISDALKDILKYKPYLAGKYLKSLPTEQNRNEFAKYVCLQTNEIYSNDEIFNIGSLTAGIVVGGIVGVATMGMGVGVALAAGGAVTAVEGTAIYVMEKNEGEKITTGATIGKISGAIDHETYLKQKELAQERELNALFAAFGIAAAPLTHTVGKAFKTGRKVAGKGYTSYAQRVETPKVTQADLELPEYQDKFEKMRQYLIESGHADYLENGTSLTLEQKKAIVSAHKVGGPDKKIRKLCPKKDPDCIPDSDYDADDIRLKVAILHGGNERALFPVDARDFSLRQGITGNQEVSAKTAKAQRKAEKKAANRAKRDNKKQQQAQVKENRKRQRGNSSAQVNKNLTPEQKELRLKQANLLKRVHAVACYKGSQCRSFLHPLIPGFKKMIEKRGDKGAELADRFLRLLDKRGFDRFSQAQLNVLKQCLDISKGALPCNNEQIETMLKFMETDFRPRPHPYFYQRLVDTLSEDHNYNHFARSMKFMYQQQNHGVTGKLAGDRPRVITDDKYRIYLDGTQINPHTEADGTLRYFIGGKTYTEFEVNGLIREQRAIDMLPELGLDVTVLPEDVATRAASRRDRNATVNLFDAIRREDHIGQNRNPDLIIHAEGSKGFIADIYSPHYPVSKYNPDVVVNGILLKSETKRQTNRVIVYIENYKGNPGEIAAKIRKQLGESNPKPAHLEEASILYYDRVRREPNLLPVWP